MLLLKKHVQYLTKLTDFSPFYSVYWYADITQTKFHNIQLDIFTSSCLTQTTGRGCLLINMRIYPHINVINFS